MSTALKTTAGGLATLGLAGMMNAVNVNGAVAGDYRVGQHADTSGAQRMTVLNELEADAQECKGVKDLNGAFLSSPTPKTGRRTLRLCFSGNKTDKRISLDADGKITRIKPQTCGCDAADTGGNGSTSPGAPAGPTGGGGSKGGGFSYLFDTEQPAVITAEADEVTLTLDAA